MRRQLRFGAAATTQSVRPRPALGDVYGNLPLYSAFLITDDRTYRMTDLGMVLLSDHYTDVLLARNGETNADRTRATRVAVTAISWLQQNYRRQTPADYVMIDRALGELAPAYAGYQSALLAYQTQIRALKPLDGINQGYRTAYHRARLHYICPEFVSGAASQDQVRLLCDMRGQPNLVVDNNFAIAELPEEEWTAVWRGLTLIQKLRWFEFRAVVEAGPTSNRHLTYLYTAIAAICKAGNATLEWCESRIRQMTQLHGLSVDKAFFNPPVLSLIFHEFVVKLHITSTTIYNMLLAWNAVAESRGVSVIMWAVEQMGCVGATAALMVADTCTALGLRYEALRHAGVADAEVQAFITTALNLIWDRLACVITPTIDSSKYQLLATLCRGAAGAEGPSTYDGYMNVRGGDRGLSAKAKLMMVATKSTSRQRARQLLDPTSILRSRYNMAIVHTPGGDLAAVPQHAAGPHAADQIVGATPEDLLAQIPPSDNDLAWLAVCDGLKACGLQQPWPLLGRDGQLTPYRTPDPAILRAAARLGVQWVPPPDPYVLPPVLNMPIVRAAWDLGCLGARSIPDPYDELPWDDDQDDDNGPPRPRRLPPQVNFEPDVLLQIYRREITLRDVVQAQLQGDIAAEQALQREGVRPHAGQVAVPGARPAGEVQAPPQPVLGQAVGQQDPDQRGARFPPIPEGDEPRQPGDDNDDNPPAPPGGGVAAGNAPVIIPQVLQQPGPSGTASTPQGGQVPPSSGSGVNPTLPPPGTTRVTRSGTQLGADDGVPAPKVPRR